MKKIRAYEIKACFEILFFECWRKAAFNHLCLDQHAWSPTQPTPKASHPRVLPYLVGEGHKDENAFGLVWWVTKQDDPGMHAVQIQNFIERCTNHDKA